MSVEEVKDGWNAIDRAMKNIYGDQEPEHYAPIISSMFGGNDPLDGISVYTAEEPVLHWHFVTYGFSELYEKEMEDAEYSGYGFELTFRLKKADDGEEPPAWALNFLQNLARYVFNSGNVFKNGDYMDANGPISLETDTDLTALAFITDPELPEMQTPNGKVEFLQLVGITSEELEAMQIWNTIGVLHAAFEHLPKYVTDLTRTTFLNDEQVANAIQRGSETEGSNTGFLFNDNISWQPIKKGLFKKRPARITLGAKQAKTIGQIMKGRMIKGLDLRLVSNDATVIVSFAEKPQVFEEDSVLKVVLNQAAVDVLVEQLEPKAKEIILPNFKELLVQIVQTEMKDQEGNVVETIG